MFLPTRPTTAEINRFIDAQRVANFSYAEIGATRDLNIHCAPDGYTLDHNRIRLGKGQAVYSCAVTTLYNWRMFETDLTEIHPPRASVEVGNNVAVLARHFRFWSLNACRIVYLLEEKADIERRGFAYGTLRDHGEQGEERFMVEWHRNTGEVWYDLLAFSRPNHILARIGYPVSRILQKRFASQSKSAMVKAMREVKINTRTR